MAKVKHHNRQAQRSRKVLQAALLDLLCEKPYKKITISDITRKADLARPTFYAHYETKDHLLTSIIDEFLLKFFDIMVSRDVANSDLDRDKQRNIDLFKAAADSSDVACLLKTLDVDALFLARFKHYWAELISVSVTPQFPNQHPNYATYINDYLAYSFYAILKRWIQSDMEFSPEIMGNLLFDLTGLHVLLGARKNFHENIKKFPAKKH